MIKVTIVSILDWPIWKYRLISTDWFHLWSFHPSKRHSLNVSRYRLEPSRTRWALIRASVKSEVGQKKSINISLSRRWILSFFICAERFPKFTWKLIWKSASAYNNYLECKIGKEVSTYALLRLQCRPRRNRRFYVAFNKCLAGCCQGIRPF